jgi:hypothetical protein
MKTHPFLARAHEVPAYLDGRLSLLVRPVVWGAGVTDHDDDGWPMYEDECGDWQRMRCPFGVPSGSLWWRETWRPNGNAYRRKYGPQIRYKADYGLEWCPPYVDGEPVFETGASFRAWLKRHGTERGRWRPSTNMPRWVSRITTPVVDVRVMQVQSITEADAIAAGMQMIGPAALSNRTSFARLWDADNARRPGCDFESNPCVWAVTITAADAAGEE